MVRRTTAAALALAASAAGALIAQSPAPAQAAPPGTKDVTAVMFSWTFDSVARACTDTLGPAGYGYVQVSPPQEHIQGEAWWTAYQPVSYKIAGRLGDRDQFRAMVDTCHGAGVKVVADAVVNHMSAGSGTGTGGSPYTKYDYPAAPYSDGDFNDCRDDSIDYGNRYQVQNCELVGLSDLRTGKEYVRQRIADYLNDLLSLGVDGFRVDAVKHIPAEDLSAVKAKLTDPGVYWKQEAIHGAGEAVQPDEYLGTGDVQEFRYARDLKRVFQNEKLAYLGNFGESWGYLNSDQAAVFVANHDTERHGDTLNYTNGADYTLAHVFMLAWPYGAPDVHSGYAFGHKDAGPPNGGTVNVCYQDGWTCQHAWPEISSMVGLRNTAHGQPVTNWWDNGNDAIAFGRGDAAYVALNREGSSLTHTFQTSLPGGTYCDVQSGNAVTVDGAGRFTATLAPGTALALHTGARDCSDGGTGTDTGVSLNVEATTQWGENIHVAGDCSALGGWDTGAAPALDPAAYPVWKLDLDLPGGTTCAYKYIRKDGSGGVTWESGANRSFTVPSEGRVTLDDTWRT
ncbi:MULTISPECIES: carbohydrate-binding module family 20 domain-containing protein [unclassified Streptomyces]|uniref:carbohydrate-binding module family 20 domain-containing protein n=1 Tax=unclassified Streptomyces TaxID=2593676 RepID=UPI0022B5EF1E|nr:MULTISPECIES: carbohydrate-binding module family 20 domain-containing protein [unclassified Streptomyces]MCZ7413963.1 alpha-amylase family glycosyl hydrolase [Streptomyces sp. WMMC897]MCZ7430959.1 alpha-amylase family glycosyl hydrolase [Streptomyces sp. WMMC1477]